MKWDIGFASVVGSLHIKHTRPCQDASICCTIKTASGTEVLLAAVSDGAGSASKSDLGSKIATEHFLSEFSHIIQEHGLEKVDHSFVLEWLKKVQIKIKERALQEGAKVREFSCTLLGAIVGADQAIFFQIGDGAIVISEPNSEEYSPVFWPQHGEFANQTNFVTQENASSFLEYTCIKQQFNQVALFTDGMERLILNFTSKTVHTPALSPIFDWLRKTKPDPEKASEALASYLNSEMINARTNDDKSLIMAIRTLQLPETLHDDEKATS